MNQQLLDQLIAPIAGAHLCGQDISFSQAFDDVREARRQDDPTLAQGDWEMERKMAQWPKVRALCEDILRNKSKDLQIACWYAEALCQLHGFQGLHFGLQVLEVLLTDYWEFFYPELALGDLEERAGKIEWLNRQLPLTVRSIPLTDKASGGYSWLRWDESRSIDNLGLKDAEARERAIAGGKLAGETFDRAAAVSGLAFYQKLHREIVAAKGKLADVEKHVDERFGKESPGLKDLHAAVRDCDELVARIVARLGGAAETPSAQPATKDCPDGVAVAVAPFPVPSRAVTVGEIRSRADAVSALRQVSQFFRQNEPHSPVALLVDRAAKWAEMPLEHWLASVIKDDSTLNQLRELLDIPRSA